MTRCVPCVEQRLRQLVADRTKKLLVANRKIVELTKELSDYKLALAAALEDNSKCN